MKIALSAFSIFVLIVVAMGANDARAGHVYPADAAFDTIEESNYFQNGQDGQFWQKPEVNPISTANGNFGSLALDFGGGSQTGVRFTFSQNGTVVFLNSAGVATGDFIAPLQFTDGYALDFANGSFTNGLLDPSYLTAASLPFGAFDPTKGLQAYRFNWPQSCPEGHFNGSLCTPDGFVAFQAIFIEIDPEDFMIQFNYQNQPANLAGLVPTGSLEIDGHLITFDNTGHPDYFLTNGPNFCFHAGALADCADVIGGLAGDTVPEPDVAWLLAVGGLGLFGLRGRSRQTAFPA